MGTELKIILSGILVVLVVTTIVVMSREENLTPFPGASGTQFRVVKDFPDHEEAAKLMDSINSDLINYLRYLREKYLVYTNTETGETVAYNNIVDSDQGCLKPIQSPVLVDIVTRLVTNYNPEELIENRPGKKDTSYTIDKGRRIHMCLRSIKPPHPLHDKNVSMFVILHEMAHVGNPGWGHGAHDFWPIFKFLLYEAVLFGIWKPVDYAKHPVEFCSLRVTYTPLYDENLPNLWEY